MDVDGLRICDNTLFKTSSDTDVADRRASDARRSSASAYSAAMVRCSKVANAFDMSDNESSCSSHTNSAT